MRKTRGAALCLDDRSTTFSFALPSLHIKIHFEFCIDGQALDFLRNKSHRRAGPTLGGEASPKPWKKGDVPQSYQQTLSKGAGKPDLEVVVYPKATGVAHGSLRHRWPSVSTYRQASLSHVSVVLGRELAPPGRGFPWGTFSAYRSCVELVTRYFAILRPFSRAAGLTVCLCTPGAWQSKKSICPRSTARSRLSRPG